MPISEKTARRLGKIARRLLQTSRSRAVKSLAASVLAYRPKQRRG
jgi:hypothetical protein